VHRFIRSGTDTEFVSAGRVFRFRLPPCGGRGRAELGLLDRHEAKIKEAFEDLAWITARDLASEQALYPPQLVVGLLPDRELDPVTLRGQGLDDCARYRTGRSGEGQPAAPVIVTLV